MEHVTHRPPNAPLYRQKLPMRAATPMPPLTEARVFRALPAAMAVAGSAAREGADGVS